MRQKWVLLSWNIDKNVAPLCLNMIKWDNNEAPLRWSMTEWDKGMAAESIITITCSPTPSFLLHAKSMSSQRWNKCSTEQVYSINMSVSYDHHVHHFEPCAKYKMCVTTISECKMRVTTISECKMCVTTISECKMCVTIISECLDMKPHIILIIISECIVPKTILLVIWHQGTNSSKLPTLQTMYTSPQKNAINNWRNVHYSSSLSSPPPPSSSLASILFTASLSLPL